MILVQNFSLSVNKMIVLLLKFVLVSFFLIACNCPFNILAETSFSAEYSAEKKVSASILEGQLHAIRKNETNTNLRSKTIILFTDRLKF